MLLQRPLLPPPPLGKLSLTSTAATLAHYTVENAFSHAIQGAHSTMGYREHIHPCSPMLYREHILPCYIENTFHNGV
jgi:hypothetical protein